MEGGDMTPPGGQRYLGSLDRGKTKIFTFYKAQGHEISHSLARISGFQNIIVFNRI